MQFRGRQLDSRIARYLAGVSTATQLEIVLSDLPTGAGGSWELGANELRDGRAVVLIAAQADPELVPPTIAHEATHIALRLEDWALTATPSNAPDLQLKRRIGGVITNAVQHGEIERRLRAAGIDTQHVLQRQAAKAVADLERLRPGSRGSRLDTALEALLHVDDLIRQPRPVRRRIRRVLDERLPEVGPLADRLCEVLTRQDCMSAEGSIAAALALRDALDLGRECVVHCHSRPDRLM